MGGVSTSNPAKASAACDKARLSSHCRAFRSGEVAMSRTAPALESMLRQLIETPSVSCVESSHDMSNRPVAELAAGWLSDLGFETGIVEVPGYPGKVNLLATLGRGDGGLVLAGHLDTVPATTPGWRDDPFRLRKENGHYLGLGTADMKSFLAVAISAAARFRAGNLREPVIVLGTADEESSMCGGKALVSAGAPRARHAVIGEPTGLRPIRAHKGILFEAIRVHGAAGHSSNPALGRNALEGMHVVMQALMDFRKELARDWHNAVFEVPQPTLNFGHLHGGDTPNRICPEAELHIDLRTLPGMGFEVFRRTIRERVQDVLQQTQFTASFEALFEGVDAMETPAHAPLVRALEEMTGHQAGAVAFATEAPYLRQLDMDVVICGPGEIDQAHQPEERVSLEALTRSEAQVTQLIEKFCL